jgi:opacity protein-like surface antigen
LLLAGSAIAVATPASAEDVLIDSTPLSTGVTLTAMEPVDLGDPAQLSDEELIELRGGEGLVVANQTLVAITSGNVISGDYVAGNVTLSDFALSNFNGVGNVLINTGGQVSLQTGMNLTINVGE